MKKYYINVLKNKYAKFDGRATRKEFWMFELFYLIFSIILVVIDNILGFKIGNFPILSIIYLLILIIPSLAISFRRLHDTSHSAWWLLIQLIPFIGTLVVLVFYFTDSTPGTNKYGPNPKDVITVNNTNPNTNIDSNTSSI